MLFFYTLFAFILTIPLSRDVFSLSVRAHLVILFKPFVMILNTRYPNDIETIVSEEGYGKNPYIETTKKLVVVTAPGPNSGKLGTCLSQLYHENKRGVKAGYAKFETFPVWNLSLMHPVNVAYEAATADLADVNMIDTFHLEAYGETVVSYNRDLSTFPILKNILTKIIFVI